MARKITAGIMCAVIFTISLLSVLGVLRSTRTEPADPVQSVSEKTLNIHNVGLSEDKTEMTDQNAEDTPPEETPPQETPPQDEPPEETDEISDAESGKTDEAQPEDSSETGDTGDGDGGETGTGDDGAGTGDGEAGDGEPGGESGGCDEPGGDHDAGGDGPVVPVVPVEPVDPDEPEEPDEPDDPEPYIYTDLSSGLITAETGQQGEYELSFEAYVCNADEDAELGVSWQRFAIGTELGPGSVTPEDGGALTADGNSYRLLLTEGKYLFLFSAPGSGAADISRIVTFSNNEFPPVIEVYLGTRQLEEFDENDDSTVVQVDGDNGQILVVRAYSGKTGAPLRLSGSNTEIRLDGALQNGSTGGTAWEQSIWLKDPDEGDVVRHTLSVSVTDDYGAVSAEYAIDFRPTPIGTVTGRATFILDCTAVGYGVLDTVSVNILKGYPASYCLIAALGDGTVAGYPELNFGCSGMGFEPDYDKGLGGPEGYVLSKDALGGFYLTAVGSGGMFDGASPDELLTTLLVNSGYVVGEAASADELREFDFTNDSGWMYFVNDYLPNRGFSDYILSDGDTVRLCFTLAKGRDIGAAMQAGDEFCYTWRDGNTVENPEAHAFEVVEDHPATCTEAGSITQTCSRCGKTETRTLEATGHSGEELEREEPGCEADGSVTYHCTVCGETWTETIAATGHQAQEESRTEPGCETDGSVTYHCTVCDKTWTETIAATGHDDIEESRTEPGCETDGSITYVCSVCGRPRTERLAALGHSYSDGVCTRCGAQDPSWKPPDPEEPDPEKPDPEEPEKSEGSEGE